MQASIHFVNNYLLLVRSKILRLHQSFIQHHQLSFDDLLYLNNIYQAENSFNFYQNKTWSQLINAVDIIPEKIIRAQLSKPKYRDWRSDKTHNLFKLSYAIDKEHASEKYVGSRLGGNTFYGICEADLYTSRLIPALINKPKKLAYLSINAALNDYIWLINTSPAYMKFRKLRELNHKHTTEKTSQKQLINLTAPNRIDEIKYYKADTDG